jgi:hypothetical protein
MSVEFYDNGTDWNYLGATWDQPDYAPAVMLTPNVPATLVSKPYYAPIGATVALIGWYPSPNNTGDGGPSIVSWNDGDWAEVTNAHLEETTHDLTVSSDPVTGIFHGGLPDTATEDFAWDGAADASASTRTTKRTIVRENMFINPRAVTDNAWGFWPGSNGAGTFSSPVGQAGWAFGTTTAFRCTWTKSADPNASGGIYTAYAGPVTPGLRYAVALQIRTSKPQRMILDLEFHDAADAWVAGSGAPHILDVPANTVITLSVLSANGAPPTATKMNITCYSWQQGGGNYSDWAPGDWLEGTNMQFEQTDQALTASGDPVTGMFSGATPDTLAADYAWVGAPNASHSRRTSPPPLTWDGSTCLGPLPSSGRWVDVPASTRWDELAAGTTWDTWH